MFKDYFLILEVHFLASDEIIKTTYRKLCQRHHPDKGGSGELFQDIQEAYDVLSDQKKRKIYQEAWVKHYIHNETFDFNKLTPSLYDVTLYHVKQVLVQYLDFIRKEAFEEAYHLISKKNQEKLFLKDFVLWQKLVAEIHHLLDFQIHYESHVHEKTLIITYNVKVKEYNKLMNHVEEDFFSRKLIYENNAWKVLLSDVDTRSTIRKYKKILALKKKSIKKFLPKIDENHTTKYISKKYFLNNCEYERLRFLRYGNPFSILYVQITSSNDFVAMLHHVTRALDCYCEYNKHDYLILLPETTLSKCEVVAQKIKEHWHQPFVYHAVEMTNQLTIKELLDDVLRS